MRVVFDNSDNSVHIGAPRGGVYFNFVKDTDGSYYFKAGSSANDSSLKIFLYGVYREPAAVTPNECSYSGDSLSKEYDREPVAFNFSYEDFKLYIGNDDVRLIMSGIDYAVKYEAIRFVYKEKEASSEIKMFTYDGGAYIGTDFNTGKYCTYGPSEVGKYILSAEIKYGTDNPEWKNVGLLLDTENPVDFYTITEFEIYGDKTKVILNPGDSADMGANDISAWTKVGNSYVKSFGFGEKIQAIEDPTTEGNKFVSWLLNGIGVCYLDDGYTVNSSDDLIFTASWKSDSGIIEMVSNKPTASANIPSADLITDNTEMNIQVGDDTTGQISINLPSNTLSNIAGNTLSVTVNNNTPDEFEIDMAVTDRYGTSGDYDAGLMAVTVPYDASKGTPAEIVWVEGDESMDVISTDDGTITFETYHNSTYRIVYGGSTPVTPVTPVIPGGSDDTSYV